MHAPSKQGRAPLAPRNSHRDRARKDIVLAGSGDTLGAGNDRYRCGHLGHHSGRSEDFESFLYAARSLTAEGHRPHYGELQIYHEVFVDLA